MSPPLPAVWPSAWPSLRAGVIADLLAVDLSVLIALGGTFWLGAPGLAWWVALLPLLSTPVPLTRPARTRAAFTRAAAHGAVRIDGHRVRVGRRRAVLNAAGAVRYYGR